jgi:hypothetical protein
LNKPREALFPRRAILFEQKRAFGYLNPANARK